MKFRAESDELIAHFTERAAHYKERADKLNSKDRIIVRPNDDFNRKRWAAAAIRFAWMAAHVEPGMVVIESVAEIEALEIVPLPINVDDQ
jgi:hypothetical protein